MDNREIAEYLTKRYLPLGYKKGLYALFQDIHEKLKQEYTFEHHPRLPEAARKLIQLFHLQSTQSLRIKQYLALNWLMMISEKESAYPLYTRFQFFINLLMSLKLNDQKQMENSLFDFANTILNSRRKREPAFEAFKQRLHHSRYLNRSGILNSLISKTELLKIYDELHQYLPDIETLRAGESYRIDKRDSRLPRTLTVLRARSGEFRLLLETKSKIAGGNKRLLPKKGGTSKTGKSCWRIDTVEEPYFNLQTTIVNDKTIMEIKAEVDFSHSHKNERINLLELGPLHKKGQTYQIGIYSQRARGTLGELLKCKTLERDQQDRLIHDILLAVEVIHQSGDVHQDIKPDNILIYGNEKTGYRAKLNDFGLSRKNKQTDEMGLATVRYQSPELAVTHASSAYKAYFNDANGKHSLGYEAALLLLYRKSLEIFCMSGTPHQSNDMWALGIMIFEIRYNHLPSVRNQEDVDKINQDPLLKALLRPLRSERSNIEEAIEIHSFSTHNKERMFRSSLFAG